MGITSELKDAAADGKAADAKAGDDTGVVTLRIRGEAQLSTCSAGASIVVQNAHVRMIKDKEGKKTIHVIVDKWGKLRPAGPAETNHDWEVKEDNNISAVEYELK